MADIDEQEASSLSFQGRRNDFWYLDNGCSRHMTGYQSLLTRFEEKPKNKLDDF